MTQTDSKHRLVQFLEEKAFRPVRRADASKFPDSKRDMLKDIQRRTEQEIKRFHQYSSAGDVATNFRRDLSSEPAKRVHCELKQLGLPSLEDVREQFLVLAKEVGQD